MNPTFKIVTDIDHAQIVWETLSPKKVIADEWDFRNNYNKLFSYPIHFYTFFNQDEPVALLPLQWNDEKNYLEFFGGSFMEDNQIYVKKGFEYLKVDLIKKMDKPANLEWMNEEINGSEIMEYKYEFPIHEITSIDNYLEKYWSSKSRSNLRSQLKKIEENDIEVIYDDQSDFNLLVEFNKKRFGSESSFHNPKREAFIKSIIERFDMHFITIKINGEKVSVGMSLLYNDTYIGLNSGTNLEINGLGKFLSLQKIQQAIKLGAKIYDARAENLGWKESFHFIKRPQYHLKINL